MGEINPWYWNKFNLFDNVSPEARQAFLQRCERRDYRRGEHLFRARDIANRAYFLESGLVKIYHLSSRGALTIFWFCTPGDLFGAGGIVGSDEQSVYAQSVDQSVVFSIARPAFEEVLQMHPAIALNVIKLLGARLRLACDAMCDHATEKVETRLARLLLRLARNWGEPTSAGVRFRVQISHQEMANMIGASRQTTNRVLREYIRNKWLGQDGRTLILRDPAAFSELLVRLEQEERAVRVTEATDKRSATARVPAA